jgi:hypothetical protein
MSRAPGALLVLALVLGPGPSAWSDAPPPEPLPPVAGASAERRGEPATSGRLDLGTGRADASSIQSQGVEIVRLVGALAAVGVLLAGSLAGYRWLAQSSGRAAVVRARARTREYPRWFSRWIPSAAMDADRITIVTRSYLGSRESICLVEVGQERFLIGVTASTISLLGRLDSAGRQTVLDAPARPRVRTDVVGATPPVPSAALRETVGAPDRRDVMMPEPRATDFSHELLRVSAPGRDLAEHTIRTALARSRDRLARLSHAGASDR